MERKRIIVVEGPQGTGKSTLANYLRDNIAGSNQLRMSGQKDKTLNGKEFSKIMYYALIHYLEEMQKVPMDFIFDRTFFTEEVYARLGYKEYQFTDIYNDLVSRFVSLDYSIYYLSLYLENVELYRQRLKRIHHNYQEFSLENSINQQRVYHELYNELLFDEPADGATDLKAFEIPMDDFDKAYSEIRKILRINEPKK